MRFLLLAFLAFACAAPVGECPEIFLISNIKPIENGCELRSFVPERVGCEVQLGQITDSECTRTVEYVCAGELTLTISYSPDGTGYMVYTGRQRSCTSSAEFGDSP